MTFTPGGEISVLSVVDTARAQRQPPLNHPTIRLLMPRRLTDSRAGLSLLARAPLFPQVKIELYSTRTDFVRAGLEFAFILNLIMSIRQEVMDILDTPSEDRMRRLFSAGSYVDFLNFALSAGQARVLSCKGRASRERRLGNVEACIMWRKWGLRAFPHAAP